MKVKTFLYSIVLVISIVACKESPVRPAPVQPSNPPAEAIPPPPQQEPKEKFSLIHKVRQPTIETGRTTPVLILLHGLGSNEEDLFKFAAGVDGRFMVISARAPLQIGVNQYSWYPLKKTKAGNWTYQELDLSIATRQIKQFITEVREHYSVDRHKIYVGGFSQGAILALGSGLKYPLDIRGIISMSGELYPEFHKSLNKDMAKRGTDIFISHGKKDEVLTYDKMLEGVKLLKENGYRVTEHYYDAAHTITENNYKDMLAWLKSRP